MGNNILSPNSIFNKTSENDLIDYLVRFKQIDPSINVARLFELSKRAVAYYSNPKESREELRDLQTLEKRWYASLRKKAPDFEVYGDPAFLADLWACWIVYSRRYLLDLRSKISQRLKGPIESILDLGCGAGYTTAALAEIFPNARVVGTNLKGTLQYKFAKILGDERKFQVSGSIASLGKIDLVFASEYFEHLYAPISHLNTIILTRKPRYFFIANSFGTISVGHFLKYLNGGEFVSSDKIGRYFNAALRKAGYKKIETGLWNERPTLWERVK